MNETPAVKITRWPPRQCNESALNRGGLRAIVTMQTNIQPGSPRANGKENNQSGPNQGRLREKLNFYVRLNVEFEFSVERYAVQICEKRKFRFKNGKPKIQILQFQTDASIERD